MKNLANQKPKRPKKAVDYFTPKKAFDSVMEFYPMDSHIDLFGSVAQREADRLRIADELKHWLPFYSEVPVKTKKGRGQGTIAAKGTPVKNITAPTLQDFKVDVDRQIRKVIRIRKHLVMFFKRYVFGIEDLTKDEQHLFAGYEQRLGSLFIRTKIYPLGSYFVSIRKDKAKP